MNYKQANQCYMFLILNHQFIHNGLFRISIFWTNPKWLYHRLLIQPSFSQLWSNRTRNFIKIAINSIITFHKEILIYLNSMSNWFHLILQSKFLRCSIQLYFSKLLFKIALHSSSMNHRQILPCFDKLTLSQIVSLVSLPALNFKLHIAQAVVTYLHHGFPNLKVHRIKWHQHSKIRISSLPANVPLASKHKWLIYKISSNSNSSSLF